jgi:hypothetical protein
MFFIIGQKIINLLLKTNVIFNYKIGIIGFLFYFIIFIFIKSPVLKQINWNNWMLFIFFIIFLLIDGLMFGYEYINKIKQLEKTNEQLHKPLDEKVDKQLDDFLKENLISEYETTTDLETTQEM